jgi:hypothetical protein
MEKSGKRFPLWLAAALLTGACARTDEIIDTPIPAPPPPPVADGAGNWAIPATLGGLAPDGSARLCTPDGQTCAALRRDRDWVLELSTTGGPARRLATWQAGSGETFYGFFPILFREAGGAWLIGIERDMHARDAAGARSTSTLWLFRAAPGAGAAPRVLEAPTEGTRFVRPCRLTPHNAPAQPAACWQDHVLESSFFLDRDNRAGPPRFILDSHAESSPDPTAPAPAAVGPSGHVPDSACTYRRFFVMDAAAGRYLPDAPLPPCERYLSLAP